MIVMGMTSHTTTTSTTTRKPIDDIDLPELPDFLKPKPSTARPLIPIQDIDLPDGASVIQPDESEIEEPKEEEEFFGCLGRLYACEEAGKVKCPNTERCIPLQPVVSEVEEEETREQEESTGLLSEGEEICSEAFDSQGSGSLLVIHPTDCTKFYNCQPLTNGRYIAHEQSCPPTTGFDATLQICNFIGKLPRCSSWRSSRKKKLF